ncbi:hypothetical protein FRB99_007368 [Tulasnella sp. 403]|nr:hypothetical protein FRB99_007368 [Tulasnella sp. 403]
MASAHPFPAPPAVPSTSVFKNDIFKGKVLFCTGGGSGICKAMTEAIVSIYGYHMLSRVIYGLVVFHAGVDEAWGFGNYRRAKVSKLCLLLDRLEAATKELTTATGQRCIAAQADVRKPEQLHAAVQKTIEAFGRIDFVICGAAGNFLAPISGLSENAFRTVIEIDTLGTYNTVKATLPHVRSSHGAYIHVSATLHYSGTPYQAHVSAAKAGVDALSNVIAVEEGPRGVRSNIIAPGPIGDTEGMERLSAQHADAMNQTISIIPLQRMGEKQDCANMAVFLFSEAANWITGQILVVDGGSEHLRPPQLPYPSSVLDPEGTKSIIKGKL